MKPRNPRQGKWNQSSTRIPKSRARQPSLPTTTAICVCKDKGGPIKTLVYQSSPNGGKAQQHISSPQEQLFFPHFTVSVYEGKAKCLKRPAQVVGWQRHAHQAGCSPAAGVWQTRGYCSQRSRGPQEGNSLSQTPTLSTPSPVQPGNSRRQRIKGH